MQFRIQKSLPLLLLVALVAAPVARAAGPAGPVIDTEDKKTIYAIGLKAADGLRPFNLTEAEIQILAAGLADAILNRPTKVKLPDYEPKFKGLFEARSKQVAEKEGKEAEAYIAKMKAEKDAKTFPSGLIMIEMKPGTGPSPKATDQVKVHYHGTLRDGTVFDSSVERGTPADFPLNQVIPCWTEALQQMKVGGKAKIVCPAAIAYGDRGYPPKIAPGAALTFEVELLEIGGAPGTQPTPPTPHEPN